MELGVETPGTSDEPSAFTSAQAPTEPSNSPNSGRDGPEGCQFRLELGGSARKRFKSSAFTSSLSWDSDSEKEAIDEEELHNFSNPHGLAAHSPGSPSSGLRLDSEDDQELDGPKHIGGKTNSPPPVDDTKMLEPITSQLSRVDLVDSVDPIESNKGESKTKAGEDGDDEEAEHKRKETPDFEKDVYTFPGDTEPECSRLTPQAHCMFVQRCRKKKVLLQPLLGAKASASTANLGCQGNRPMDMGSLDLGVYDFVEDGFEEEVPEKRTLRDKCRKRGDGAVEPGREIFTCVECSIYFRKQEHLREHMSEHGQSRAEDVSAKTESYQCAECGWSLPNGLALAEHHRRHRESRLKILEEIEKLNGSSEEIQISDNKAPPANRGIVQHLGPDSNPDNTSEAPIAEPPAPLAPSHTARARPTYRRRYVCTYCNFSTRTSQALANHVKTHYRKKAASQVDTLPSSSASSAASSSSKKCAFPTSCPSISRQHRTPVHPVPVSGKGDDQMGPSTSKSSYLPDMNQKKSQHSHPTAEPTGPAVGSQRPSTRANTWAHAGELDPEKGEFQEREEKHDQGQRRELNSDARSPGKRKPHSREKPDTDESLSQHSAARSLQTETVAKDGNKKEMDKDGKVFPLRRSRRVTAAVARVDSDEDDDVDEEDLRRFLSEHMSGDGEDNVDEDGKASKSVERKCPYCPDRFQNGIGLANHVRGHLNRVGVSYNVRHFISPAEVNAIEKKFSYQKKKKKVANFDPDTFSMMRCEFCSAGFDTRAGLSSHARAHLRDFGITNWDITISPIHILRELFSSRPDLVIPTAPPRSRSSSSGEEEDKIKEEEEDGGDEGRNMKKDGVVEVKLEKEASDETGCALDLNAAYSEPCQRAEKMDGTDDSPGLEDAEDGDKHLQPPAPDGLSPGKAGECRGGSGSSGGSLSPREDADSRVENLKCKLCDAKFETRRGLSSHARSHLRQLSVGASDRSGAPIDLLYRVAMERHADGKQSPASPSDRLALSNCSSPVSIKDEELDELDDLDFDEKAGLPSYLAKAAAKAMALPSPCASPPPSFPSSPSSVVKKAPISSLLPLSSPLRSPESKTGGIRSCMPLVATTKPLWAPQDSDAPLNLAMELDANSDIVCQLCGAWFETRKGLSSHARAHLRHFGVEYSESKGSPINMLTQLMDTDDFKHKGSLLEMDGIAQPAATPSPKQSLLTLSSSSTSTSSSLLYKVTTTGTGPISKATSSSASALLGPPAKRLKASSLQVFRLSSGELMALPHNEPPREIGCEFCGEYFENRKGLSSHARSHLRQMGITEWTVNGSPIDTLREIISRRGLPCALPPRTLKNQSSSSSSPGPPRSPVGASAPRSAGFLGRLPFAFARPSSPPPLSNSKSGSGCLSALGGLSLKVKCESEQVDVTSLRDSGKSGGLSVGTLNCGWSSSDNSLPLNLARSQEAEPTRDIRCEFCGEYFENRKGLSSHARSHLRQMGITEWSVNGSPIDTLREIMHKKGVAALACSELGVKKEASHEGSSPPWEPTGTGIRSVSDTFPAFPSSKYRNSPVSLLQLGSRLHKAGLGPAGSSAAPPIGRLFQMSPLGKRPLSEEFRSSDATLLSPHRPKTMSLLSRDFSVKTKPSLEKHQDPSCELCGFYFENRKALASHARAHLRQFGVTEWSVNGSPIETLSAWMRSRPQKVLEMHRNYMRGSRSGLKKVRGTDICYYTVRAHRILKEQRQYNWKCPQCPEEGAPGPGP